MKRKTVMVTGATGYVGGRLVPKLLAAGYNIRALGRSASKLSSRPWANHPMVQIAEGDVLDPVSLSRALAGCDTVFYLVHSMVAQGQTYAAADRTAAENMVAACARQGVERIVYLGGLGDIRHPQMSRHLRSRHEVGDILQSGPVPATVLRAAMILGSGSASFEILRYLVERLPLMITPKWVNSPCQPISISSVLAYLQGCLEHTETAGRTFDIGDNDVLTYRQIIDIYTEEAGLPKRWIIPVPVLTPTLSAYWIHLITPVPAAIAMPLTEGLSVPVICMDNSIRSIIPLRPASCRDTIRKALDRTGSQSVATCWSDTGCLQPPEWAYCGDADYAGGTILECGYRIGINTAAEHVWDIIVKIGGATGYYYGNKLWRLRGIIDRFAGGVGLRRGRRHPSRLLVGDALDFWRVLEVDPPTRLLLLAEMKMPGEALLDIRVQPDGADAAMLQIFSRFLPRGLGGIIYWYTLYPIHQWLFRGMLKAMAKTSGATAVTGPERFTAKIPPAC